MPDIWFYSLVSVFIVSLISLVGILTFPLKHPKKLERFLMWMVSFSAGAFLGDVFIHLLPDQVEKSGFNFDTSAYILLGILVSFVLEKIIHWRHSHSKGTRTHYHPSAIMSLVGDAVHNFIDGLIIATSFVISFPVGVATTVAVIFHEIPQEIGNYGVLLYGGFEKNKALLWNFMTALTSVVGVVVALAAQKSFPGSATSFLVPFTAGNFIYIAGSDLIPELHKEVAFKKSTIQFIFLVAGIAMMALLLVLE